MLKPLILVDGSSYLYRAFHALPALKNSKGFPTGAIYGMINMLRKLMTDFTPENMAIVFDAKGKTFRDDLYEHYKANRSAMPDELSEQIPTLHRLIKALGIPMVTIEGVEADDVIGTLAKAAEQEGVSTLVSTSDKDFAQLVNKHITLMNTMTGSVLNPQAVVEKFGLPPECMIDYLALVGDSIDNIPGISGVGPKTAAKWLQEFGSLDLIIANADKIKGKVGESLRAGLDQLPLSKQLATIKCDVKLDVHFSKLKLISPDEKSLLEFYKELEFKSWLNELLEKTPKAAQAKHENYKAILEEKDFLDLIKKIEETKLVAFDVLTMGLNYMEAKIIGLAFAMKEGVATYLPLSHADNISQLKLENVLTALKPLLESSNIKIIGYHLKYVAAVLENYGIKMQGLDYDTMLASYILDSASVNHAKDTLALKYLGWRMLRYEDLAGKGAKQIPLSNVSIDKIRDLAAEFADVAYQLHQNLWPKIIKQPGLKYIYEEIETPLLPILGKMERHGVLIDCDKLYKQNANLEKKLKEYEVEITKEAGISFNVNSPKQLQEILFKKLNLPILQKTPTGQPSTADAVLQELALEYNLPKLIIEYRALNKLITTYTNKLPELIHHRTKRLHTSYNQTGTSTGRLSSSDPNLQNIPIRTEEGRRIREAFIVPEGYKMIAADYSQIELRIMAHLSEDPNLLKAFSENLDIHTATAAEVLGIPLEQVSHEERRKAKAINFGLIYGMSAFGLAKQIGVSREAAQIYMDRYFARYPNVLAYMENSRKKAHDSGYVETLWGRRLYVPDINSSQIMRQKAAERAAINAPLQGSAADIIKRAMISLDRWIQANEVDVKMIMQVHDELVFEVANGDVSQMLEVIQQHMMGAANLKVPLLVSIGVGDNWNAASKSAS